MPTFDATALTRLRRVGALDVSADGSWLAIAVQRLGDDDAYASDLWRVAIDPAAGGAPRALTRGPSKDGAPRFGAGGLYFLSDRRDPQAPPSDGDDKRAQVWLLPAGGGEPVPVTDEPLGVTAFRPRPGGGLVVLAEVIAGVPHAEQRARARDRAKHGPSALRYRDLPVRHWDQWVPDTSLHVIAYDAAGARVDLTPEARHEVRNQPADPAFDVSPDGARVAVAWARPSSDRMLDSCVRVIDVASGQSIDLGATERAMFVEIAFAPDGRAIAATRVLRRRGAADLVRLWIFDGGRDPHGHAVCDWDAVPHLHGWTRDGARLLVTADDDGHVPAFTVEAATGAVTRITAAAAAGTHEQLRALDDGRVVGVRHRFVHPPEPFVCDGHAEATPRLCAQLSGFTDGDGAAIAAVEYRMTAGDGGTPVGWFLLRPTAPAAAPSGAKALLWIHGGPIGQYADGWHWRWNPLVAAAAGYAVALPNPRGSTGRGQRFMDEVQGNEWGGACYRDLMAITDELEGLPGIDRARVAAMGGSFGGYMANWIGSQTDRFRALVTHASIFHFDAFHGTTDYPAWFALEMAATPYDDGAPYARYSPHKHVAGWKTPTLVIHGEKDYRVAVTEGLLLFEALRLHGVDAELLVFPDENHWILRPRNIRAWYEAWMEFVARHMP